MNGKGLNEDTRKATEDGECNGKRAREGDNINNDGDSSTKKKRKITKGMTTMEFGIVTW